MSSITIVTYMLISLLKTKLKMIKDKIFNKFAAVLSNITEFFPNKINLIIS